MGIENENLFTRRGLPGRASQVKSWVSQHLVLTETDLITVAELTCHEPGCPPVETVVTVHELGGRSRSWHIHRPLAEVDQAAIVAAFSET